MNADIYEPLGSQTLTFVIVYQHRSMCSQEQLSESICSWRGFEYEQDHNEAVRLFLLYFSRGPALSDMKWMMLV